ncbi:FRG domain-containing protein [Methylomonas methanica]|uniref:FRG domain protein n=1 Tax=Methylomonas methanica (strain DSM 25384 / MC09) TaxID=857087 RepID=G0A599_METMM|nr:FRG domain-containing protein [Methylomonas methanica]AEG00429.1 FRG domain protein [Methylomonas methanica MC09]
MTKKISTLDEFMNWVNTSSPQENNISFYRGHEDEAYKLMPRVYRDIDNKSYRKVEYQLYQDLLTRNPNAFVNDKTIFERLVRMQHHNLPTRLLDITQSSLVALFFACQESSGCKNGEVILFRIAQSEMIYPSAIPKISLAWLEVTDKYISQMTYRITFELEILFKNLAIRTNNPTPGDDNFLLQCNALIKAIKGSSELPEIFNLIQKLAEQTESKFSTDRNSPFRSDNKCPFEEEFDVIVKDFISEECERMRLSFNRNWNSIQSFFVEFTKFYFVYPPLNNERIRRQQGAFIIFPSVQTKYFPLAYFDKIIVDGGKKKEILTALEKLGITRGYLFPELDEQAKDTCLRYPLQ